MGTTLRLADEHRPLVEHRGVGLEDGREVVGLGADEVVGADEGGVVEPELRELGQDLPLVRDERGQDEVEGRDPVRGDDEQLVAEIEDVADLALLEKRETGELDIADGFFHDDKG